MTIKIKVHERTQNENTHIQEVDMREGVDINDNRREIAYNPNHQDNLDTSVEHNPIVDKTIIPGVEVWSIFQRKWSRQGDGNPFIYALKKEKGWHFRSENDRNQIEAQINAVVDKFLEKSNYNATILIPSSSDVNNYLVNLLISKSSTIQRKMAYCVNCPRRKPKITLWKTAPLLEKSMVIPKNGSTMLWAICGDIWIR